MGFLTFPRRKGRVSRVHVITAFGLDPDTSQCIVTSSFAISWRGFMGMITLNGLTEKKKMEIIK